MSLVRTSIKTFASAEADVSFVKHKGSKADIRKLSGFIDDVLGEYNYFTARNHCMVTLSEALDKGYLYMKSGRYRKVERDSLLEWVYWRHPELDDDMSLPEAAAKRDELLASDELYHFYNIDTVEVNVFRRMTRGTNTPSIFMGRNLKGLHKHKNGHLGEEENITRKHLYNSYLALKSLWEMGYVPVAIPAEKSSMFTTSE